MGARILLWRACQRSQQMTPNPSIECASRIKPREAAHFKRQPAQIGGTMLRLIIIMLLATMASQGYTQDKSRRSVEAAPQGMPNATRSNSPPAFQRSADAVGQYKCDGRIYCSQMTSCAEATYFLRNCPGVKMDGNNDGIPCEKQWCKP